LHQPFIPAFLTHSAIAKILVHPASAKDEIQEFA
jgi:hypothetical protein